MATDRAGHAWHLPGTFAGRNRQNLDSRPGRLALLVCLGLTKAVTENLEHPVGDLRVLEQERLEVPRWNRSHDEVGRGGHGRAAPALVQQRHLAEMVACPKYSPVPIRDGDLRLAVQDHHEPHAIVAAYGHLRTPGVPNLTHLLCDLLQIAVPHASEELHRAQVHS